MRKKFQRHTREEQALKIGHEENSGARGRGHVSPEAEVEEDTNFLIKQQWNAISATSLDTINLSVQIGIKKLTMLNKGEEDELLLMSYVELGLGYRNEILSYLNIVPSTHFSVYRIFFGICTV